MIKKLQFQFWKWVKRLAQRRMGEKPDSITIYGREIQVLYGMLVVRYLDDPTETMHVIWQI